MCIRDSSSTGLETVVISDGATEIWADTFYGCSDLVSVVIPATVEEIGDRAFYGCSDLESILFCGTEKQWLSIDIGDYNTGLDEAEITCNYVIPDATTAPENEETVVPEVTEEPTITVESTSSGAELQEIPTLGKVIAFGECSDTITWSLDENGLLFISGEGALDDPSSWKKRRDDVVTVVIDSGITEIGENVFRYHEELAAVYIADTVTEIGDRAFYELDNLVSIIIPGSVKEFGEYIFYGSALQTLTIEEGVTAIHENALRGCDELEQINLPDSLTTIEDRAIYECGSLKSIVIPCNVNDYGEYIFYGSALEEVTFAEGITTIGENAFRGCEDLITINLPSTLECIEDRAFYECPELLNVTIPGSVKEYGEFIFYGSGVETIIITEGLEVLPQYAIRGLDDLTSIVLPSTVIKIEDRAIYECKNLTSVVIPQDVTEIGEYVFYGCDDLESIYYCGTEKEWLAIDIDKNVQLEDAEIICNYVVE